MKLGIYGGSFAPIHFGHINAALSFYDKMALGKLLVMPAKTPPHKKLCDDCSEFRFETVKLAFSDVTGNRNIEVSDFEMKRDAISYTVDTLEHFASPENELYFLCGTDMFLTLEEWKNPKRIFELAHIVCVRREHERAVFEEIKQKEELYKLKYDARITVLDTEAFEISSTELRDMISRGENTDKYIPANVREYIDLHGMYGSRVRLDELKEKVRSYMGEKRYLHTLSVTEEAERLASIIGLPDYERFAVCVSALLHDITKDFPMHWHKKTCKKHGLADGRDYETPNVLHQLTGAYIAKTDFGYITNERICTSISCHTTGRKSMNVFDKILFIADYIEPQRKAEACISLREHFYRNIVEKRPPIEVLNETVYLALENTISHLKKKNDIINFRTLDARDSLKEEVKNK